MKIASKLPKKMNIIIPASIVMVVLIFGVSVSPQNTSSLQLMQSTNEYPKDTDPFPKPPPPPPSNGNGNSDPKPPPPPRPDNPNVSVSCPKAELTVALMIDRSNSVISESLPGTDTPRDYKNAAKNLIDQLYNSTGASRLDVYVYAFATKAVLQNRTDSNGNYITNFAASQANRDSIRNETIGGIHFRNDDVERDPSPLMQAGGNSPGQRARGYDAGTNFNGWRPFGLTNWYDAFLNVRLKSEELHEKGIQGNNIDVAIMLTDGYMNVWNGGEYDPYWGKRTWNEEAFTIEYWTEWANRYRTNQLIDHMRTGDPYKVDTALTPRIDPTALYGILIRPVDDGKIGYAKSVAGHVFHSHNYFFANNFTDSLTQQVVDLVDVVSGDTCGGGSSPAIELKTDYSGEQITIKETKSKSLKYFARNVGDTSLVDVAICQGVFDSENYGEPCKGEKFSRENLNKGEDSETLPISHSVDLGADSVTHKMTAYGYHGSTLVHDSKSITINPERIALPS